MCNRFVVHTMRSQWPPKKVRQRCASAAVMFSMYADEWFSWLGRQTGWCIQTLPCVQQSNPTLFQRKVRNCSFVTSLRKVANVQASHCSGLCVSLFVCLFVCLLASISAHHPVSKRSKYIYIYLEPK